MPVAAEHCQYLGFAIAEQRGQYKVAPFGASLCPADFFAGGLLWNRVFEGSRCSRTCLPARRVDCCSNYRAPLLSVDSDSSASAEGWIHNQLAAHGLGASFLPPDRVSALRRVILSFAGVVRSRIWPVCVTWRRLSPPCTPTGVRHNRLCDGASVV